MRAVRIPFRLSKKYYSTFSCRILGIETSCDDTGVAVVDSRGSILGESLVSQQHVHLLNGGILPPLARDLHARAVEGATNEALRKAGLELNSLDAVAVTVGPGLPLSLRVGLHHAKQLASSARLPLIPIHHMEAHALTARINPENKIEFPYLVLLISGGHSLLACVRGVDDFITLGSALDDAPGEAFDKIARRLKLANLSETCSMGGGQAIEYLATKSTNPFRYSIAEPMLANKDCNFSFSGVKNSARKEILTAELEHGIEPDETIPGLPDMCAGVQLSIAKHLCRRLQRAIEFLSLEHHQHFFPIEKHLQPTLVVSGGVASNSFIKCSLSNVCSELGWRLVAPPPKLCTDNGVMIAWNGVEKFSINKGIYKEDQFLQIDVRNKWPLGEDAREAVANENIKCSWISNKIIFPSIYCENRTIENETK